MPSRYLKESLLASRKLNEVSAVAERLYVRMLVVVDDFGRYVADPTVLASKAYPRRRGAEVDAEVSGCLSELAGAGLIEVYVANGESHLEIVNFRVHNPPRSRESKFPGPEKAERLPMLASARIREQVQADASKREQLQADPPYSSSYSLSGSSSLSKEVPVPPDGSTPAQVALIPEPPPVEKPKKRAAKAVKPPDDPQKRPDADAWVTAYKAGVPEADRVTLTQAFWVQWSATRKVEGIDRMLRSLKAILAMPRDKFPRNASPLVWVTTGFANGITASSTAPIASGGNSGRPVTYFKPDPVPEWTPEMEIEACKAFSRGNKVRKFTVPKGRTLPEGFDPSVIPEKHLPIEYADFEVQP